MKTRLPVRISSILDAQVFLKALYTNGEAYHPEDDALNIDWDCDPRPTVDEQMRLNLLMADIYNLPGNDGRHCEPMVFDPCTFLLELDPEYLQRMADSGQEELVFDDNIHIYLNEPPNYKVKWTDIEVFGAMADGSIANDNETPDSWKVLTDHEEEGMQWIADCKTEETANRLKQLLNQLIETYIP